MRKSLTALLLLVLLGLATGCTRENIWCTLVLVPEHPDGIGIASWEIDSSLKGNYIRNVNTLETYSFPQLIAGKGRVKVMKGMYALSFDAVAELEDGSYRKVRFTGYSTEANAVAVLDDDVTLTLPLTLLK